MDYVLDDENQLALISQQLTTLEGLHVIAAGDRTKILDKLHKEPGLIKTYGESLSKGLPGVTGGVIDAIKAGKSGDPYAISIAALDIFAGVLTMAGPLLGPAAPIFSALTSMISTILGEFLPKPPSLKEELTALLNKFVAEEKLRNLGVALDQIWILTDTIENHSLNYDPLNLRNGPEINAIDGAWQWLSDPTKQTVPEWGQVLEKTCKVWVQLLRCVTLCVVKPSTKTGVEKENLLVYFPARQELFLGNLRLIKTAVQEQGLYGMMQEWSGGNILYVAIGRKGSLPWDYKKNTGWLRNFSIHIPQEQLGSPTPHYKVIARDENTVARFSLDSTTGDLFDGVTVMHDGQEYADANGGGKRRFEKCVSAWALPAWDDRTAIRVYTAHDAGSYCYVNIHQVDTGNKVTRINWEPHTAGGLQHIRAVVCDITKSLPGDPDVAALASRQYEIIYAGCSRNSRIWVELDNSWTDVPSPWPEYHGIEVDPYCLWVFGAKGFACATHASVIQCKNGKLSSPRWTTYTTGWEDGFDVRSLSPCADGTLTVGSDQPRQNGLVTWSGVYNINLKEPERRIDWNPQGATRGGSPRQIQKMPIPCWPIFTGVLQDLEERVGANKHR